MHMEIKLQEIMFTNILLEEQIYNTLVSNKDTGLYIDKDLTFSSQITIQVSKANNWEKC